ncbi:MAG: autotransporter outer membrane beta-barrel domain-containing protein, partial [Herbaspirillum sp.]
KLGAYVDTWLQYGWFSNRVNGDQLPTVKYHTQGWAISGEAGYALPLGDDWVVEPQGQLLYVSYRKNGVTESNGTQVLGEDSDGWTSRLGVRTYRTFVSEDSRKVQPYVTVNWWYAGENRKLSFDQTPVDSPYASDRYELELGVSGEFDERWAGWSNVSGVWDGLGSYQYVLRVGVKYTW